MRSLFFKIFACFWLSHILVGALIFGLLAATQAPRDDDRRGASAILPSAVLVRHARIAAERFERGGTIQLTAYLQEIEGKSDLDAVLFDAKGKSLSSRAAPNGSKRLAMRAALSDEVEFAASRGAVSGARRVRTPRGAIYVLVAQMPRRREQASRTGTGRGLGRRQTFEIARLVAICIAAGVVSFGLARYVTAPTVTLRRAARQIADGDLSTRVGAQMGRRRDELADLGRDFDLMAERIQSLLVAERRLLGDISHELRSPLARLQVALDLAGQSADDQTRPYLERIELESARLNALIGQLLTLSRLETAGAEERRASVDLSDLVGEIASDADFEARGHNRSVQLSAEAQCRVMGNSELLRSAIENVVRNAVRYTAENTTVEIILRRESVAAGANVAGAEKWAMIRVRDYGAGVPPESLARLFDPFYRVESARDRQSGGVGLGLSITARAVRWHGGTVKAENAPDGGLIIEIVLPLTSAANV